MTERRTDMVVDQQAVAEEELWNLARELGVEEGLEIIDRREGGLITCWIPVDMIDNEEVPVKETHVEELARNMTQLEQERGIEGSGLTLPVNLGLIDGEPTLKIIDGFHRSAAIKHQGHSRIYAVVERTTWEGLFDARIFNAKDHAHVRFSRVVQWVEEDWKLANLGLSADISAAQAMSLKGFGNSGSRLGLTPEDVATIREWVENKEELWGIKAMTMHAYLKIAESVDPSLVHAAREKRSGHELTAPTQDILKIFSQELPDKFELQNLAMEYAMLHNLKGPIIRTLCIRLAGFEDIELARAAIEEIEFDELEPTHRKANRPASLRKANDIRRRGKLALAGARTGIEKTLERIQQSLDNGEEITPEMRVLIGEADTEVKELRKLLGQLTTKIAYLGDEDRTIEKPPRQQPEPTPRPVPDTLAIGLASTGLTMADSLVEPAPTQAFLDGLEEPDETQLAALEAEDSDESPQDDEEDEGFQEVPIGLNNGSEGDEDEIEIPDPDHDPDAYTDEGAVGDEEDEPYDSEEPPTTTKPKRRSAGLIVVEEDEEDEGEDARSAILFDDDVLDEEFDDDDDFDEVDELGFGTPSTNGSESKVDRSYTPGRETEERNAFNWEMEQFLLGKLEMPDISSRIRRAWAERYLQDHQTYAGDPMRREDMFEAIREEINQERRARAF